MTTLLPGFTNIVHLTDLDGIPTVTRQGRRIDKLLGIDRVREASVLCQIKHLGIGPDLLHVDAERDRSIFRAIPGLPLDSASTDQATLARTLRVLSVLHSQPARGTPFSTARMIRHYLKMNPAPDEESCLHYARAAEQLEKDARRCLCHNDCVAKNWILQPNGEVRLIDFEFAGPGDPAFDLATWCLSFNIDPEDPILGGYKEWNQALGTRVRAYFPVVDTVWMLFCGLLSLHLADEERSAADAQMRVRIARLGGRVCDLKVMKELS